VFPCVTDSSIPVWGLLVTCMARRRGMWGPLLVRWGDLQKDGDEVINKPIRPGCQ
jgi:hypothetical protein